MQAAKRFRTDETGATAIIFALSVLPLLGLVGAAMDYGRATAGRTALQRAADSTALALVRQAGGLKDGELQTRGGEIFNGIMANERQVTAAVPVITRSQRTIRVAATGEVRTVFMGSLNRIMGSTGQDVVTIGGESEAAWSDRKIELALVLDNTGSMARAGKMPELKAAVHELLNMLEGAPNAKENIKVSVVPFDTQVRLPTVHSNQPWLKVLTRDEVLKDKEKAKGNEWKRGAWVKPLNEPTELAARNAWAGYVSERDLYRRDPITGQAVEVKMNVKDDRPQAVKPETLYPMVRNEEGAHLPFVQPLTNQIGSRSPLRLETIDRMQPRGCTDITIGAMWGLETLSRSEPFAQATEFGTADVEKVMILLTDGWNTRDAFHSVCGEKEGDTVLDKRTAGACDVVKGRGVTLISIKVIEGSDALLRDCASQPTDKEHPFYRNGEPLYYPVTSATQLTPVFQKIASQILQTRLTH